MARVCQICARKTRTGGSIARRGLPKKKGGVGLKTTGHTKRKYYPNLQRVRVMTDGRARRMVVCTRCIKSGRIKKPLMAS
jgi:large subunit ribosomal protein L28